MNIRCKQYRDWHLPLMEIWGDKSLFNATQYMFVPVSAFRN